MPYLALTAKGLKHPDVLSQLHDTRVHAGSTWEAAAVLITSLSLQMTVESS